MSVVTLEKTVHGIDGCPGGWLVLTLKPGESNPTAAIHESVEAFSKTLGVGDIVAIDMPIGLPAKESPVRGCDREARRILGERHVCVFSPPCRAALKAQTYGKANEINRQLLDKGLTPPAWGILPKIRELDNWLREPPDLQEDFHEVHPEMSFAFWRQEQELLEAPAPFLHRKIRATGREERRELIERVWPKLVEQLTKELRKQHRRWAADDLHDAFACLWTACRLAKGVARGFPSGDQEPVDTEGLRMVIHA